MSCSRTQHGGGRSRTPDLSLRSPTLYHWATALPGIAEDFGLQTCSGYPGSEFHLEQDAQTFAEWCVDYLKFDGCNSDPKDIGYTAMGFFLNKTGRPIVYSCEWPFYQRQAGMKVLNSDQLLTVLDLKNALTMFYCIKGNFCVVQFPLNFMVSINPQKLKTNPWKLSRCPNVWIKMTTWPDSKVKDFWIISLAYAKSFLELIFGYNFFFIYESIFKIFAAHFRSKGILNNDNWSYLYDGV